jgi:hypothetical protein
MTDASASEVDKLKERVNVYVEEHNKQHQSKSHSVGTQSIHNLLNANLSSLNQEQDLKNAQALKKTIDDLLQRYDAMIMIFNFLEFCKKNPSKDKKRTEIVNKVNEMLEGLEKLQMEPSTVNNLVYFKNMLNQVVEQNNQKPKEIWLNIEKKYKSGNQIKDAHNKLEHCAQVFIQKANSLKASQIFTKAPDKAAMIEAGAKGFERHGFKPVISCFQAKQGDSYVGIIPNIGMGEVIRRGGQYGGKGVENRDNLAYQMVQNYIKTGEDIEKRKKIDNFANVIGMIDTLRSQIDKIVELLNDGMSPQDAVESVQIAIDQAKNALYKSAKKLGLEQEVTPVIKEFNDWLNELNPDLIQPLPLFNMIDISIKLENLIENYEAYQVNTILVPEYNNIEKILKELKGIQDKLNTQETSPTELEGLSEQINLLVKDLSAIKDESTLKINTQTDKLKIDALIAEILTLKQNPFMNAKDIKPLEKIQIDLEKVQLEMKKGYVNPDKIKEYEQSIKKYEGILDFRTLEEEARKELREASQSEIVREIGPNEEIYLRRAKIRLQAFESRTKLDFLNPDYLDLDKGQREALEKMKVYVNQELQNPSGKSVNELNRKLSKMFNDFPHSQASYRALYKGLNSSGAAKNITDQNTIKRDQNVYYAKNAIKKNLQGLAKVLVAKPKLEKKKPLYTPPSFFTNVVNFFRKKLVPRSIAKQAAVVLPQLDTNHGFNEKKLSILHQKLEGVSNLLVIQANFDLDEEIQPNENEVKKYFEENPTTVISVFGERHLDGSIEVYEIPPLGVGAMIKEEARYRKEGKANPDKLMSTVIQRYKTEMSEKDPSNPTYQLLLAHEKKILISDTMRTMLDEALVEVNELNNPNNEDKIVTKLTLLKNQMKELENLPKESSELRNMVQDISLLVNQMINALPEEIQEKIKNAESLPEDAVTTPLPPALEPVPPPPPLPVIPVRPGSLDAGQIAAQEGARQAIKLAQLMGKGGTSPSEQSTNISLPNSGGPPYAPAQQNAEAAYAQQAPTTTGGAHKKGDEAEPYVTAPPRTGPTTK